jgi:hypothetical protein
MEEAGDKTGRLGIVSLFTAAGLFLAAGFLGGYVAVAAASLGGIALAMGLLTTVFAPGPSDRGGRRAPRPKQAAAEPQQDIALHVDAPASVRRWLERVEHQAEAEAAKRGR